MEKYCTAGEVTDDMAHWHFMADIIDIIERKRLQWYGHVKRMQDERLPKLIMELIPGERRKRGRP